MATRENELNAHDPEWQRYAVQLARLRVRFVVKGLNQVLDAPVCRAIKEKFNFELSFDDHSDRMHFIPKD
jgi:hypothetical protein